MKAILIKTGDNKYYLNTGKMDGLHLACYPHDITKQRLSLKNCQAVENGYDLDELVESVLKSHKDFNSEGFSEYQNGRLNGIYEGFQKALEILGDKKFTEEEVNKAMKKAQRIKEYPHLKLDEILQSLQQTEWDVSFNPDEKDSESCLILKRTQL